MREAAAAAAAAAAKTAFKGLFDPGLLSIVGFSQT
jgi:hypothetical protein